MDITQKRLDALQKIADTLVDKLSRRVAQEEPETMNPQAIKHITGMLKDLRDIQLTKAADAQTEGVSITLTWDEELRKYSE